mgnify:CR=1 FL=1
MGCFPCSTIIPIFAIVIIIILVFFQKKTENFNSEPFPAENCESLKKKNNIDCKCVRKYDSHNQCTTKINCVESTSEISGYEENYTPFNPPVQFTNWIKEKMQNSKDDVSAACNDYLKVLGLVATAHAWVKVLEASFNDYEKNKQFYEEKIQTANFFFNRVLPRIESYYLTATTGSKYIMDFKFN